MCPSVITHSFVCQTATYSDRRTMLLLRHNMTPLRCRRFSFVSTTGALAPTSTMSTQHAARSCFLPRPPHLHEGSVSMLDHSSTWPSHQHAALIWAPWPPPIDNTLQAAVGPFNRSHFTVRSFIRPMVIALFPSERAMITVN